MNDQYYKYLDDVLTRSKFKIDILRKGVKILQSKFVELKGRRQQTVHILLDWFADTDPYTRLREEQLDLFGKQSWQLEYKKRVRLKDVPKDNRSWSMRGVALPSVEVPVGTLGTIIEEIEPGWYYSIEWDGFPTVIEAYPRDLRNLLRGWRIQKGDVEVIYE